MGMKFRKSYKLLPGVKVNIGKKSMGISAGNKYGGVNINSKTGVRTRVSVPGTGISFSETSSKSRNRKGTSRQSVDIEPFSTVFDEKTIRSLNDVAFNNYLLGYSAYARTVKTDSPEMEEVEQQIKLLAAEQSRRFQVEQERESKKNEPSLLLVICGLICGVCGILMLFFSLWGFFFLSIGLIMLIAEYRKEG